MVVIRLTRVGKKNHPTFRVIVSDKRKDTLGIALEILGAYNPHTTPTTIDVDVERAKHWLSVGAQPSDTVHNLFVEKGILPGPKRKLVNVKPAATADVATEPKVEAPAA